MIALGDAELSPKAEIAGGSRERENTGALAPAPGILAGAITKLFRELKATLTDSAPAPEPQAARRREKGDMRGLFRVARSILHTTRTVRQHFRGAAGRIFNTAANRRPAVMRTFREMAATARHTALPTYFFHDPGFSREERRAEAERVLRMELDEWAQEAGSTEQQTGFHYAADANFDPQPWPC
jgi:hypothetical protein